MIDRLRGFFEGIRFELEMRLLARLVARYPEVAQGWVDDTQSGNWEAGTSSHTTWTESYKRGDLK